jgi:hypothetical protein
MKCKYWKYKIKKLKKICLKEFTIEVLIKIKYTYPRFIPKTLNFFVRKQKPSSELGKPLKLITLVGAIS